MNERSPTNHTRVEAMAREWCRMLGEDPDGMVRSLHGHAARYLGYMNNMRRLLGAADCDEIQLPHAVNADLLAALERITKALGPWLVTADSGLPAVPKTIRDCADLHTAQRVACAAIARAKGETT